MRESSSKVRIFKSFKEHPTASPIKTTFSAEGIYGGTLLGIRSNAFLNFYDWETGTCVRRVDVVAKNVIWSESDLVAIICEDAFYVLKFDRTAYQQAVEQSGSRGIGEEGIEESFEFVTEISES